MSNPPVVPMRYFNEDDYTKISDESREQVIHWLEAHSLLELNVTLISDQPDGPGIIVSGLGAEYDPEADDMISQYDHKVVATFDVDDFPWEVLDTIPTKENLA